MENREKIFQYEINGLNLEIEKAKNNLPGFRGRHFNKTREQALIFILEQAVDLADGSLRLSSVELSASCSATVRVLLEYLFWACWVASSNENATKYSQRATGEIRRNMTKILKKGYGKITKKKTNVDVTQEILDSDIARNIPQKIEIRKIAEEVGLEKLYLNYYSFLSTASHGGLYGIESAYDKQESILADLAFANVILACINLVTENWISKRQQTPIRDILRIMRVS